MNHSVILHVLNAELAMLSLFSFGIFLHYIFVNIELGYEFLRAAIAFTTLFFADMFLRFPLWYTRQQVNMGFPTETPDTWIIFGGILMVIAFLCIIRVFSPLRWGHRSWMAALFASSSVTISSLVYTFWR